MSNTLQIRIERSFANIDREAWDSLHGVGRSLSEGAFNPFLSHAFLSSLEDSGSATAETGWMGHHLLLETGDGKLVGAVPCYLKSHSQGEYVFDYGWADAFERAGGRYFPKLQASLPFTPATAPHLLFAEGYDPQSVRQVLAEGLITVTNQLNVSSAHVTFIPEDEIGVFEEAGYLHRTDQQFHFLNQSYESYDAFLDTLSSRKRKNLKKERRAALENDISIDWLTGDQLTEEIWDQFFMFYMDTGSRKWGQPYLTREFYSLIGERMARDILLIMAKRDGRYIAGAINFIGSDSLFGRHWGCIEDHRFLHFEVCYHQAIDYAIAQNLARVEAGAQGEHKLARGYVPVTTHSAHYIAHEGFRNAVSEFLAREREDVADMNEILSAHTPYKKTDGEDS